MGAISHPQTLIVHLALSVGDGYMLMRCAHGAEVRGPWASSLTHHTHQPPSLVGRGDDYGRMRRAHGLGEAGMVAISHS